MQDKSSDSRVVSVAREVTAKTLSCLPGGHHMLQASIASSKDGDFHERQVGCAQEETHSTAKHVSALALSVQQYSDIIERNHTQVDPLIETLVGLQADMKDEPPTGIPADLHADLETDCRPCPSAPPEIKVDDEADDAGFADQVEGAYATAYQMRALGIFQLETGIRDTMRREAAMDDAIFRPNLRTMGRIMLSERQVGGQDIAVVSVHKNIRKRKRESKNTD
jgi:hypothetical protein